MMNNFLKIFTIAVAGLTWSCGGQKATEASSGEFFNGLIIQTDDSKTIFTDCLTSVRMEVEMSDQYKPIHERLREQENNKPLYIEFLGTPYRTSQGPIYTGEEPGTKTPTIVIDSLLRTGDADLCNREFQLPGIYESTDQATGERSILRLIPDYTYTITEFNTDGTEVVSDGIWHRNAILGLILTQLSPSTAELSFSVIPSAESLSRNSGKGSLAYRKVYLF